MIKELRHRYSMGSIRLWRWLLKEIDITDALNDDPIESMDGFLLGDKEDEGAILISPFIQGRLKEPLWQGGDHPWETGLTGHIISRHREAMKSNSKQGSFSGKGV